MTAALAASTRPRLGVAVKVVRMRPRRYSDVMYIVAITIITIRPMISPKTSVLPGVSAPSSPSSTPGAMSPEPLRTNEPPERWELPGPRVG